MKNEAESWDDKVERWNTPFHKKALRWALGGIGFCLKSLLRYFYPKATPENPLSELYVKAFHCAFLFSLVVGFFYYFFLFDNSYIEAGLERFFLMTDNDGDRDETRSRLMGSFLILVSSLIGLFFFDPKRIPDALYRGGMGMTFAFSISLVASPWALDFLVQKLSAYHRAIGVKSLLFLLMLSWLNGFVGVQNIKGAILIIIVLRGGAPPRQ